MGAVIVHDCLPTTPQSQSEENPTGDWVGTVWRSIVKYTLYTPCNVKVIDTDWGVGIIEYTDDTDFVVPERLDMDYAHFLFHRDEFMHIYNWTQISDVIDASDRTVFFYPERLQKITNVLLRNLDALTDLGLANGKMGVALYLYRLNKVVNDQYLELEIFAAFLQLELRAMLVLIGTGRLEQAVRAQAQELGITDHILFAGLQNNVADWYQMMDLFVMPSRFEGLPVAFS